MKIRISDFDTLEKALQLADVFFESYDNYVYSTRYSDAYYHNSKLNEDYYFSDYSEKEWNEMLVEFGIPNDGEASYISEVDFENLECIVLSERPEGSLTNYTDSWRYDNFFDADEDDLEKLGFRKEWIAPKGCEILS